MMEAIREALEDCAGLFVLADSIQSFEDFEGGQPNLGTLRNLQAIKNASLKAREALAELEKPAEDITNTYAWQKAFRAQYNIPDTARPLSNREEQLADACKLGWNLAISANRQYAESYHAEQCKACRKDRQPLPEAPK